MSKKKKKEKKAIPKRRSSRKQQYTGIVDFVNPRYAYIIIEDLSEDIRIPVENLSTALNGDTVRLEISFNGGCRNAYITSIIKRTKDQFIGILKISQHSAFVVCIDKKMHYDIFIPLDALKEAKDKDKVVVKLTRWSSKKENPYGEIIRVLGRVGENNTEMHAIMFEYGFSPHFPKEVEAQAKKLYKDINSDEIASRKDYRDASTFTIDPEDAKDFDDALSIRKTSDDYWEVGVHIADVSYYVKPNTVIEKEAYRRATSVYLVDRTIHMLPERLSNDLCSLKPNEDKLTFSVVFQLDDSANIIKQWFGRTIIHSNKRFTYEQAQKNIDNSSGDFYKELQTLNRLAKLLRNKRLAQGGFDFEVVELKFKLDKVGKVLDIFPKQRKDAHKMIEEWMLLANKKVANFIYDKKNTKGERTMVYRIHKPPDFEKTQNFIAFLKTLGYTININSLSQSLNNLIKKIDKGPLKYIMEQQVIKIMSKAYYSTVPLGHYGLAFSHYTHFTSPIRRYPDIMVHRLLSHYLKNGKNENKSKYEIYCEHSSRKERLAIKAERASVKYKQIEMIQQFIGRILKGVITNVVEWGMYITLEKIYCDGLLRLSSIKDDYYFYDEKKNQIIGRSYGRIFCIGDEVEVLVSKVDFDKRTIDFEFA